MGQLEKYGLYVLVLLSFLIIGVAIWGDPAKADGSAKGALHAPAGQPPKSQPGNTPAKTPGNGAANPTPPNNKPTGGPSPAIDLSKALQQVDGGATKKTPSGEDAKDATGGGEDKNKPQPAIDPGKNPVAGDTKRPDYKVKTGETFERIARDQLGHPALAAEIAKLNSKIEPTKLRAGQTIVLPSPAEVATWKAARAPKKNDATVAADPKNAKPAPAAAKGTYTVVRGDTIEGIAKRLLGDAKRSRDIQEMNPNVSPTSMKIGTVLKLPAK